MHQLTHQELFDKAVIATYLQGMPSRNESGCLYRSGDGLKCTVGHLIDDEHFKPMTNTTSILAVIDPSTYNGSMLRESLENSGVPTDEDTIKFLRDMQFAHDSAYKHNFRESFWCNSKSVAQRFGLPMPEKP